MHVKKNDTVAVLSGKDKDKIGEVLKVNPKKGTVIVSGINIVTKHRKPSRENMQGGIIKVEAPINASKVMLYCTKCKKTTRIKHNFLEDGSKVRVCRHCDAQL